MLQPNLQQQCKGENVLRYRRADVAGGLIEQCPFPKVEPSRIKECAEILDVYYQKLISNLDQIQTLEKLRDKLFPKLMSGDVRVDSPK